jgi:acyl-CoA thioester hydrolase
MTAAAETRLRVRYAETDQMGVVYYANYVVWMEVGRVALCKSRGMDYRDLEQAGILMAVVEVNCRYHAPARFDDEVVVKTWIEEANPRVIKFAYEMHVARDGRKLASGFTRHVLVDRQFQRIRLPEKYFEVFGLAQK